MVKAYVLVVIFLTLLIIIIKLLAIMSVKKYGLNSNVTVLCRLSVVVNEKTGARVDCGQHPNRWCSYVVSKHAIKRSILPLHWSNLF